MKSRTSIRVLQRFLLATCLIGSANAFSAASEVQPIAYIGHGAFFDTKGKQIDLTQEFVTKAQAFYRAQLIADLPAAKQSEFLNFEKQLLSSKAEGQARLALQQRAVEWLYINSSQLKNDTRLQSKLRALSYALTWEMPAKSGQKSASTGNAFKLDAATSKQVGALTFTVPGATTLATTNGGTAYINECIAAQVPIPPTIGVMDPAGLTGWKSQGFIPTGDQFIVGTPAELRTYSTPQGMCMALPRYNNGTLSSVIFDGVICLSKITSKTCFWDNQMSGNTFAYPASAQIPIGVANLGIDPMGRFQSGGAHLTSAGAGMCTDCHAGENPYIIHPNSNLGGGNLFGDLGFLPQNLPTFAPNRYVPLVLGSWPQNDLSQAASTVPSACNGCHQKGSAGRFPHLSNQIPGYCGTILQGAINNTMPPFNPGGLANDPSVMSFVSTWCNAPPNSSSADAGDPHITTTNGIHYDFQAAGEFTALKNADTGFELQTRQSPVITTFTPGANPWTGLASCVSLNTAAALRAGKRRITYQLVNERPQVRVDGKVIDQTKGINFGDGNIINASTNGGPLDFIAADGSHVTINPLYWSSQGYWYLDVKVQNTPAREGVMGHIQSGEWLPRDPVGSSFGARPAALNDRHIVLNQKFADAWRVTSSSSLFDYATGTSTVNFTDRNWPSAPGKACTSTTITTGKVPVVRQGQPELAKTACAKIRNPDILADCLLDVTVFGEAAAANVHLAADQQKAITTQAK